MAKRTERILVVDDDMAVLNTARLLLKQLYTHVQVLNDPEHIPELLAAHTFDAVLLDMNYDPGEHDGQAGFFWLKKILKRAPGTAVLFMTAFGEVDIAIEAIRLGAADFIMKPWKNDQLIAKLNKAIAQKRKADQTTQATAAPAVPMVIGSSPAMQKVFDTIGKVAATDASVLVLGQNGTGKELIARTLHQQSARHAQPFISVDLGAVSETLFESELFGHVKGAFTDARHDKPGRFEMANGGTLFLDEIGNLSYALQAKLLTVLQNRTVRRVGANQETAIDIRLICATNRPLYDMVPEKTFRQDLLYRINTVQINIPPLSERPDDIPPLVNHFLATYCAKYGKKVPTISAAMMKQLMRAPWPGNIRELQHATERAIILAEGDQPDINDFLSAAPPAAKPKAEAASLNLAENEKRLIIEALDQHKGNITRAAKALGIDRLALYRRLNKYGI